MSLLLALSFTSTALAFAPSGADTGVEPARVHRYHAETQARLRHQPGWQEFVQGEGEGWLARFDERTGSARTAWGPGIDLGPLGDARAVEAALRAFFARNTGVTGVPGADLVLRGAHHVDRSQTWIVDFDRVLDGVPVWRGGVQAIFRFDRLVQLRVETYPDAVAAQPMIPAADALDIAALSGPAAMAVHADPSAALVYVPIEREGLLDLVLAWETHSRTTTPVGRWSTLVDAQSGEVIAQWNEVRFLDGTMTAMLPPRTTYEDLVEYPMPLLKITGASGAVTYTDGAGDFDLGDDDEGTAGVNGSYVSVRNQHGSAGAITVDSASPTWTTAEATQAEISSYKYLHDVRAWCLEFAPEVDMCSDLLRDNVNVNGTCNAYYDGNVNFYQEGGGCANTAEIADVVYHEWGHGFHYYSLEGGDYDSSISEGIGDVVAEIQTLDAGLAPGFYSGSAAYLRESETDLRWPDDQSSDPHVTGLIFAGAVWDLRKELCASLGEDCATKGEAWEITSQLLADGIKPGPTIDESYDTFVAADDDDGDLGNGTPHICELMSAFGLHGLGPLSDGSGTVSVDHVSLGNQRAGIAIPLEGDVVNMAPQCVTIEGATADVTWSTDDGATWQTLPLDFDGEHFSGELPAMQDGSIVAYTITFTEGDGSETTVPASGTWAPYTFYVGDLEEVYCEPFDTDGGYTHALLDGQEQDGADDWMFDRPRAYANDPDDAYTGTDIWGNDLGGGRYNGEYQPDIVNRLTSVPIPTGGAPEVILQYRRWLNVEDGYYDNALIYANDAAVWTNHGSKKDGAEDTTDREWMLHTVRVPAPGENLTLAWELDSDGGKEMGGWNLDDVCVYEPVPVSSWAGISDFLASDDVVGAVALTWTQPGDARADHAVVVRRTDRFPATKDDGDVVFDGQVVPGTAMAETDPYEGTAYYAVFAGSGAGWLTGATEGANADSGTGLSPKGGGDGDGELTDTGFNVKASECGCASGGAGGAWPGVAGLAGLAVLLRRRRG